MSKYRPSLPILAFSSNIRTVRELALNWGVKAQYLPSENHEEHNFETRSLNVLKSAHSLGYLDPEDERICVLAPTAGDMGYMCGVFDVKELIENQFQV